MNCNKLDVDALAIALDILLPKSRPPQNDIVPSSCKIDRRSPKITTSQNEWRNELRLT